MQKEVIRPEGVFRMPRFAPATAARSLADESCLIEVEVTALRRSQEA